MNSTGGVIVALLLTFVVVAAWFIWRWVTIERSRAAGQGGDRRLTFADALIGFLTNFLDTLGIGSFAPTTAIFKFLRRMPDEHIPGTLNVGHALPTVAQALVFVSAVNVDATTLCGMIGAAVLGAWLGVGMVSRLSRRAVQLGMGSALLFAALFFLAANLEWLPGGGETLGVSGAPLLFAIATNFVLGALMMLGLGLYAPCLILVSVLGMSPLAAFPIMMGSCALLMPVGGARFVARGGYNLGAALGLAIGGIPAVLLAAFVVKSLPIIWLRWLVVIVVLYTAVQMLASAVRGARTRGGTRL